jgi:hypothetical protein
MSDLLTRLVLIAGVLAVAAAAALVIRARARGGARQIKATGFAPGVYLFTSSTCPDCGSARRVLIDELGDRGFEEIEWERDPRVFDRLGIDAVPATIVVDESGKGTVWPGSPERAIAGFGP